MRACVLTLLTMGLAALSCASRQERNPWDSHRPYVVELPRPNSGTFTFEEAQLRRSEILKMSPSGMLYEWQNPLVGFCIHIDAPGVLTVYNSSPCYLPGETRHGREPHVLSGANDLRDVVESYSRFQYGNPLGVLVTATNGGASTDLLRVVSEIFVPSIQIYYLKTPN